MTTPVGNHEPGTVPCRKCSAVGRFRQLVLVVSDRSGDWCQKVLTGNFHCPKHEFPEHLAPLVARSQWATICRNFRVLAQGEDPLLERTKLFYWPADEDIPPVDVKVRIPR
jgi:hypothetical protein